MNISKYAGIFIIIFFILCFLTNSASAEQIKLKLFENKDSHPSQMFQDQFGQTGESGIGIKLMGGGFYLMDNIFNDHVQGLNDLNEDRPGLDVISQFKPILIGMDFSGEIIIDFTPNFGIGIGAGYISAGKQVTSELEFGADSSELTAGPMFSAIPLTFSLYIGMPFGDSFKVVLEGGGGYYLGTVEWEYSTEWTTGYQYRETWSSKSNTLGYHGGINLEFNFTQKSAFVLRIRGRTAKLADLRGDLEYETLLGSYVIEEANLWFGVWEDDITQKEYPSIGLWKAGAPSQTVGGRYKNMQDTAVSIGGIIFQAGIKITF